MNIVWENMIFFFTRLKFLSVSEVMSLGDKGGFCVSTNCSEESWVYYPERITSRKIVDDAVKFFADRNIDFMWPVYDGGVAERQQQEVLEEAGLRHEMDFAAMTLDPSKAALRTDKHITFEHITTLEQSHEWVKTTWHSFDGGIDDTPDNYFALAESFVQDRENLSLYLARKDGQAVGTFLLTKEPALTGVYYFGVVPEVRRQGIAAAMMSEVCRLSGGKTITLQATPIGRYFYSSFGFEELFAMPIYMA